MPVSVSVNVNENIFLKDPLETDLGRRILQHSLILFKEVGLNSFNFKELAVRISSTEASIYRYFENKHMLLLYLTCWYWEFMLYLIKSNIKFIHDEKTRLRIAIKTMVSGLLDEDSDSSHFIDLHKLHHLMVELATNAYHTKKIDEENKVGIYANYRELSHFISELILEVNPGFKYPRSIATTIIEMAINHLYLAEHLPSMTEIVNTETKLDQLEEMIFYFCERLLKK